MISELFVFFLLCWLVILTICVVRIRIIQKSAGDVFKSIRDMFKAIVDEIADIRNKSGQ